MMYDSGENGRRGGCKKPAGDGFESHRLNRQQPFVGSSPTYHFILRYGVIGNTTDFDSVVVGSSPATSAKEKQKFLHNKCAVG